MKKKKKNLQSSTYRLHTFLRMLGIFYDKLGQQNQEKKLNRVKKKIEPYRLENCIWVYDHLIPGFKIYIFSIKSYHFHFDFTTLVK